GDQGNENGVGQGPVFGADEQPVLSSDGLSAELALRDVVAQRESAVFEESFERLLLIDRIADRFGHRRLVQDEVLVVVAPRKEVADDGSGFLVPNGFFLLPRLVRDGRVDLEESGDERERLLRALRLGRESLVEVPAAVLPAADLEDLAVAVQV